MVFCIKKDEIGLRSVLVIKLAKCDQIISRPPSVSWLHENVIKDAETGNGSELEGIGCCCLRTFWDKYFSGLAFP